MTAREAVGPLGYAREPVVDIAAPVLRTRRCGGRFPTAERTVTPVRQTKRKQAAIDKGDAIRERPAGFKEDLQKDWQRLDCGHVSGLWCAVS